MRSKTVTFLFVASAAAILGCSSGGGPPMGDVSGTVTLDGKPASDISVTFNPVDGGRGSFGTTDDQGRYTLVFSTTQTGALIGKHNVTISREYTPSEDDGNVMAAANPIPAEYAKMTKEVEVEKGSNTIDLAYP